MATRSRASRSHIYVTEVDTWVSVRENRFSAPLRGFLREQDDQRGQEV